MLVMKCSIFFMLFFKGTYDQKRNNYSCVDPERGGHGPTPLLKNHKHIRFLSNTDPDPLVNHKATKPAFNVGPYFARQLDDR